ncbi:hypothetical protein D9M71_47020 [compost metagenome]
MNHFVHRMLGHYLMDELEEGDDLPGGESVEEESEEEESSEEEGEQQEEAEESDELVVTIGDEPAEEDQIEAEAKSAPKWVKDLRRENREDKRRIRELEAKLAQSEPKPSVPQLGPKPTLEGCDWDSDKFESELLAWKDRELAIQRAKADEQKAEQDRLDAWNAQLAEYGKAKENMRVRDFADAESNVTDVLDQNQQGIIVTAANNPALVVYALGKNSAKLKVLAAIKDPIKFTAAMTRLEMTMKTKKPSAPPAPEKEVKGSGKLSAGSDSTLERLRAEAARTGDNSKVMAYRREQRKKQA